MFLHSSWLKYFIKCCIYLYQVENIIECTYNFSTSCYHELSVLWIIIKTKKIGGHNFLFINQLIYLLNFNSILFQDTMCQFKKSQKMDGITIIHINLTDSKIPQATSTEGKKIRQKPVHLGKGGAGSCWRCMEHQKIYKG